MSNNKINVCDNIVGITRMSAAEKFKFSKKYKLVHISDVHVISCYDDEDDKTKGEVAYRIPFFYHNQEESIDRWFSLVDAANKEEPDAVILTGDIIDFPSKRNIDVLTEGLKRLHAPHVYCLGNHDWSYSFDYHTESARTHNLPKFSKFTTGINSAFSICELDEFTIFAINNSYDKVEPEALIELNRLLSIQKPIILAMHIPICADDYEDNLLQSDTVKYWRKYICLGEKGIKPDKVTEEFISAITNEPNNIAAILAGHIHFAHQDKITDKLTQFVCCRGTEGSYSVITI